MFSCCQLPRAVEKPSVLFVNLQKHEFVNMVFDGNLYYEQGIYRTPAVLDIFSHNASKMEERGYLIYKKRGITEMLSLTAVLTNLFSNHFL
ncbi:hypothetical protein C8P67_108165 [Flavobacterium aquicola]|uniref:Uncharacterized protein n=1 Tax=Flavobacterium aquicola TaxID=1682742 RepID=A0A3E0EL08_9FLAO|nr:hypothetical protein C8P67_108165 [Flavobacterium aquicola]